MRRALILGAALALLVAPAAQAADERSTSNRLADRREVAAGTRTYAIGFEDGRFYANGWHIQGEMGGVWAPPLKLLDGIWFGVDGQWVGPATRFTSGQGYVRYDLPPLSGLRLRRTDFVPDGVRGAVFGLELRNPGAARTVTVDVDAHSELLPAYPWSGTTAPPTAAANAPDAARFDGEELVFTDGTSTALVSAPLKPTSGEAGPGHRGPQPGRVCAPETDKATPAAACDDGPVGRGAGGALHYRVKVPAHGARTLWVQVAAGRDELHRLRNPAGLLAKKIAARAALARHSRVSLPGDRLLQRAVEWGKQNLADLTQSAAGLKIRFVNQGKSSPSPLKGTVPHATWFGAGYPDYPWLFATDGEYTAFAAVALGQFETIERHLLALRDVSDVLNDRSGKVAHEIVSDGSVYFGANGDAGNTDETVKFPSVVALVWRWTGDNRFRDRLYGFAVRNLRYVAANLDADHDGWPEGLGNVERNNMGPEKLDNAVYYIRGLLDLADLARSKHDRATEQWATGLAEAARTHFDGTWWDPASGQYADSLNASGRVEQKHWIGLTPAEAELPDGSALAPYGHAVAALAGREDPCYSGSRPFNTGLFHTGCGGGPEGKGERTIFSLTTAIAAVGEGNYGRDQRRYTVADSEPMFGEPATGGEPDEQPGALPEILPSPDFGDAESNDKNIDRCWNCRAMFMQAWGHYGTAWPVIHQQLGVRPDLGERRLAIVPLVPAGQQSVRGDDIRLGRGWASVLAAHAGRRYTTTVAVSRLRAALTVGTTLPRGARVASARLDSRTIHPQVRTTDRGVEVTVRARGRGRHVLEVRAG